MKSASLLAAINTALAEALEEDDSVVVYGEDVGVNGGVFQVTAGLQQRFGKRRCFDSPLAESALVGTAVGMAMAGLKPVVEIQFSGFAWPAFNQIVCHAARTRNRSRGTLTLPLVIRMPYGGNLKALEHHVESMEATFAHVPGLKVVIPSTPHDAKGLLLGAIRDPDPVIYMEPKRSYHSPPAGDPGVTVHPAAGAGAGGAARGCGYPDRLRGNDARGAYGRRPPAGPGRRRGVDRSADHLPLRLRGDTELGAEGPAVSSWCMRGHARSGVAAELIALVTEELFMHLDAPPRRVTGSDTVIPLPAAEHYYFITAEHIVDAVQETVEF